MMNETQVLTLIKVKPIIHISTISVVDSDNVADPLDIPSFLRETWGGDASTKFVAEHLVHRAEDLGIPGSFFRCQITD